MKPHHPLFIGAAVGTFAFTGPAAGSTAFTEDFESGAGQWAQSFGTYGTGANYSGSSHGQIPGGGATYGNLISGGPGAAVNGGPINTLPVDLSAVLTAAELSAVANGAGAWEFRGWLASYNSNPETALFTIEWFDGAGGGGTSLGVQTLADGSTDAGVTQSIDGGNPPSAATVWTTKNWSEYVLGGTVPTGAQSFVITYVGQGGGNGNDAYSDLLQLDITEVPSLTWTGALDGEWSTSVLSAPKNWVETGTATGADYADGNIVVFEDGATTTSVDIGNGDVTPGQVIFDHTVDDFALGGTNGIAGSTGLFKRGTATLTLNNVNTFTGTTALEAGTLALGDADAIAGSPLATTSGSTLNFTTLTAATIGGLSGDGDIPLENSDTVPAAVALTVAGAGDYSGALSGSGSLTKGGTGTLVLNAASTFSGGTALAGGSVRLDDPAALGTGAVAHTGGSLVFSFGDGSTAAVANDIALPATGQQTFVIKGTDGANVTTPTTVELSGEVSGGAPGETYRLVDSGQVFNHNHVLILSNAGNSFEGTIQMWRGTLAITDDAVLGDADNDIEHYTENLEGALRFDAAGITLNPNRTINFPGGNNIRPFDTNGFDATIQGALTGTAIVTKKGAGTLTLEGDTSALGGSADITEGTLALAGTADLVSVDAVTIQAGAALDISAYAGVGGLDMGATIAGDGEVVGPLIAFGRVAPGASDDVIGTLTTDTLNLDSFNAIADLEIDSGTPDADRIVVDGDLEISGNPEFRPSDIAVSPVALALGTKFGLIEYTGTWDGGLFDYDNGSSFVQLADGDTVVVGPNTFEIDYDDTTDGTNSGQFVTLTVVAPADPYAEWATTNITNIDAGAPAGFDDDADGDGVDNGLEWILGGNPLAADGGSLVTVAGDAATGLTLTFDREPDSISAATLVVEWNTDLASTWNEVGIGTTDTNIPADGTNPSVDLDAPAPGQVTVNLPASLALDGRLFGRLKATAN